MDIENKQEQGRVKFNLPGIQEDIYATAVSVRHKLDSSFVWYGIIDCYEGDLMLTSKDGITVGYLNYKDKTYTLRKLCGDDVVLIAHTEDHIAHKCGNSIELNTRNHEIGLPQHDDPPQFSCISTILVLYTDAAQAAAHPESEAELLVENINQALANSQVSHRVRMVGVEHIDWDETGNAQADRITIISDPQATALRNQYSADMVMVLTGSYGSLYGISWLDQLNDEHAYTLTAITSPPGRHTFAHEWAHNLGAKHDSPINSVYSPIFAHGYQFSNGITILGLLGGSGSRRLHYSNPDVEFNGVATGVVDLRDNAKQLDNQGCTIASYRTSNDYCEDFRAFIVQTVNREEYDWCANAYGCGSNMTYIWEYSYDGFSWIVGGYGRCISQTVIPSHTQLRVKVFCVNGCFTIGYRQWGGIIEIFDVSCLEERFSELPKRNISNDIFTLYPNPTSNIVNLNFDMTDSKDYTYMLEIHNAFGKSVNLGTFTKFDITNKSIDVSQYQDGIYFITIESENEYAISKFVVKH
jgi:hypothetical protein